MSGEINLNAALTIFKPSVMARAREMSAAGLLFNMLGNPYVQLDVALTTTATAIPLGKVTQPHWAAFYSNPLFNTTLTGSSTAITNAANNGSGLIRITSVNHGYLTNDVVTIATVGGTTEANGTWPITKIDANNFDLIGSTFANTYVSGGTAVLNWSIQLFNGASGAVFTQLFPGEMAIVPLAPGMTPYGLSNGTGQLLEYLIASY